MLETINKIFNPDIERFPKGENNFFLSVAKDIQNELDVEFVSIFTSHHLDIIREVSIDQKGSEIESSNLGDECLTQADKSLVGQVMNHHSDKDEDDITFIKRNDLDLNQEGANHLVLLNYTKLSYYKRIPHVLIVSIDGPERRFGTVRLFNKQSNNTLNDNGFSEADVELLKQISKRIAWMIAMYRTEHKLRSIMKMTSHLLTKQDSSIVCDMLASHPFNYRAIVLRHFDGGERLILQSCSDKRFKKILCDAGLESYLIHSNTHQNSAAVRSYHCMKPIEVNLLNDDEKCAIKDIHIFGAGKFIIFPLIAPNKSVGIDRDSEHTTVGTLAVYASSNYDFLDYEKNYLKALATQIAIIFKNSTLLLRQHYLATELNKVSRVFESQIVDFTRHGKRLSERFQYITDKGRDILNVERFSIFWVTDISSIKCIANSPILAEIKKDVHQARFRILKDRHSGGLTGNLAGQLQTKGIAFKEYGVDLRESEWIKDRYSQKATFLESGQLCSILAAPLWSRIEQGDNKGERYFMGMIVAYNKRYMSNQPNPHMKQVYPASKHVGFEDEDQSIIDIIAQKITLLYENISRFKQTRGLRDIREVYHKHTHTIDDTNNTASTQTGLRTATSEALRIISKMSGINYSCVISIKSKTKLKLVSEFIQSDEMIAEIDNNIELNESEGEYLNRLIDFQHPNISHTRINTHKIMGVSSNINNPLISHFKNRLDKQVDLYKEHQILSSIIYHIEKEGGDGCYIVILCKSIKRTRKDDQRSIDYFVFDRERYIDSAIKEAFISYRAMNDKCKKETAYQRNVMVGEIVKHALIEEIQTEAGHIEIVKKILSRIEKPLRALIGIGCLKFIPYSEEEKRLFWEITDECKRSCNTVSCIFNRGYGYFDTNLCCEFSHRKKVFYDKDSDNYDCMSLDENEVCTEIGGPIKTLIKVPLFRHAPGIGKKYSGELFALNIISDYDEIDSPYNNDGNSHLYSSTITKNYKDVINTIAFQVGMAMQSIMSAQRKVKRIHSYENINRLCNLMLKSSDIQLVESIFLVTMTHGDAVAFNRVFLINIEGISAKPSKAVGLQSIKDKSDEWIENRFSIDDFMNATNKNGSLSNYIKDLSHRVDPISTKLVFDLTMHLGLRKGVIEKIQYSPENGFFLRDTFYKPDMVIIQYLADICAMNLDMGNKNKATKISSIPIMYNDQNVVSEFYMRKVDAGGQDVILVSDNMYDQKKTELALAEIAIKAYENKKAIMAKDRLLQTFSHSANTALSAMEARVGVLSQKVKKKHLSLANKYMDFTEAHSLYMKSYFNALFNYYTSNGVIERKTLTIKHVAEHVEKYWSGIDNLVFEYGDIINRNITASLNINGIVDMVSILIDNSRKATSHLESPTIAIIFTHMNSYLFIRVKDNGTGMDENTLMNIQNEKLTSGFDRGTGIGLSIARKWAADHQGALTCTHSKPSYETVFEIQIPTNREIL